MKISYGYVYLLLCVVCGVSLRCSSPQVHSPESTPLGPTFMTSDIKKIKDLCNRSSERSPALDVLHSELRGRRASVRVQSCLPRAIGDVWEALRKKENLEWPNTQVVGELISQPLDKYPHPIDYIFFCTYDAHGDPPFASFKQRLLVQWRHAVIEGSLHDPKEVTIRFDFFAGSPSLKEWRGGIGLRSVSSNQTSVIFEDALETKPPAPIQDGDKLLRGIRAILEKMASTPEKKN